MSRSAPVAVSAPPASLGPVAACRVNLQAQERLCAPAARDAVTAVVDALRSMAVTREPAESALHAMIGRDEREQRRRLLDLRRRIHRGRSIPEALRVPPGDEPWPEPVARWLDANQALAAAEATVNSESEDWLEAERGILGELLDSADLRLALEMSAPLVAAAAERYVDHAGALDAQDRKAERGLLQYAIRALARTSPLGRFTAVGLAHWASGGAELDALPDLDKVQTTVSYDRAMLLYALGGLLAGDPASPEGWVQINPTVEMTADRVEFVVGAEGKVQRLGAARTRVTGALVELGGLGPLPAARLIEVLAAVFERPADDARKAIASALRTGLLLPCAYAGEQDVDLLADAAKRSDGEAAGLVAGLGDRLAAIALATEPQDRRLALEALGELEVPLAVLTMRPVKLHVNEDLQLPPEAIAAVRHQAALDDLAAAMDLATLFDPMHEMRALLTRAAVDRFGEGGESLLAPIARELAETVYARWSTLDEVAAVDAGPADGSLHELLVARREVEQELLADAQEADGADSVEFAPERLRSLATRLPERFRRRPEAYAALLQPLPGDRLVLNALYCGQGTLAARFLARDAARGGDGIERQRERLERRWGADGVPLAEDRGLHRLGVNEHAAILERGLRAEDWIGLRLRHDPEHDVLEILDEDGAPLRPMALGTAWQEALPPVVRLAVWITGSGRVNPDAIAEAWRRSARVGGPTVAIPQLGTERLVLSRRRWVPGSDFPDLEGLEPHGILLALARWRAVHGVGDEVFLKTPLPDRPDTSDEGRRAARDERRREKPHYLDLASPLNARLLPRILRRRGGDGAFFEEALPGLMPGRHALEWMVELERSAGQSFAARVPS